MEELLVKVGFIQERKGVEGNERNKRKKANKNQNKGEVSREPSLKEMNGIERNKRG